MAFFPPIPLVASLEAHAELAGAAAVFTRLFVLPSRRRVLHRVILAGALLAIAAHAAWAVGLRHYPTSFRLVLSHRPEAFDAAASHGAELVLSGHTHGGQIGYNGKSAFQPIWPEGYLWGKYERGASRLYTTSGFGDWYPFRLGCPTEAPIIELSRA